MRSEEYLTKRNIGKKARDTARATYTFGGGGMQAKMANFVVSVWLFGSIYVVLFISIFC
jgi:hypothetical protein